MVPLYIFYIFNGFNYYMYYLICSKNYKIFNPGHLRFPSV